MSPVADLILLVAAAAAVIALVGALWRRSSDRAATRRGLSDVPVPSVDEVDRQSRLRAVLAVARWPFAVWITLVVVFWPGMMNPDSVAQWYWAGQAENRDWHPFPVEMVFAAIRFVGGGPWTAILLISGAISIVIGYVAVTVRLLGGPRWVSTAVVALPLLVPVTLLQTAVLWKDIATGGGLLAMTVALWRMDAAGGAWLLARPFRVVAFVAACLAVWLTRHNGWPIVLGVLLGAMLLRSDFRRPLGLALVMIVPVAMFVRVPLAALLDVEDNPQDAIAFVQRIAAHVNAGTELEPDERSLLDTIRSVDEPWPYDCSSVQVTWAEPGALELERFVDLDTELRNLWLELAVRNPRVELDHVRCSTRILWQITDQGSYTYFLDTSVRADMVESIPQWPGDVPVEDHPSNSLAVTVHDWATDLPSPLVRPALYTWTFFAIVVVAMWRRRSVGPLVVASPAIFQTLSLVPFSFVQDTRFQYGAVLIAAVFGPVLLSQAIAPGPARPATSGPREPGDHGAEASDAAALAET